MPATLSKSSQEKIGEIKSILRSLLIAKGSRDATVFKLNGMYREEEEKDIPFREFGYSSLIDFLRSIPDTVRINYNRSGDLCAYHVDTEKSAHVSSLVSRQKKPQVRKSKSSYSYRPPSRAPSNYYNVQPAHHTYKQASLVLTQVLKDYKFSKTTSGIRKFDVLCKMKEQLGNYSAYTMQNLNNNLAELWNLVVLKEDYIYFRDELANSRQQEKYKSVSQPFVKKDYSYYKDQVDTNKQKETLTKSVVQQPSVKKDYGNHNKDNIATNREQEKSSNSVVEQSFIKRVYNYYKTDPAINREQPKPSIFEEPFDKYDYVYHKDELATNTEKEKSSKSIVEVKDNICQSYSCTKDQKTSSIKTNQESNMIKDTTKFRLQKLIESHPEGIWCSELPNVYKYEYSIELEYHDLGFNSITEFVAALPDIFVIVEPPNTKRQMVLDAKKSSFSSQNVHQRKTMASLYNFNDYVANDPDPVPTRLSSGVSQKLFPEGVMKPNETVDQIYVTSLDCEDYVEVNISEIFTPSFFWITLRKNKKKIKAMMSELEEFYNMQDFDVYRIPQVLLEPGLNIACIYAKMWHRGIIKKIKPDGFVVVLFYDYGTVKTYNPNDVYFLHKKFSVLSAQAIACGLHNIKPIENSEWPTESINKFVHKVWNIPMIAIIASTNEENNTMMITLTDTSDDVTDLHINDWMVENNLAEFGKMIKTVPLNTMCQYDELNFKNTSNVSKENKNLNSKESCVVTPTSSFNNDCTNDASSVVTLVKESIGIVKQTNTITQAILLNMPINKSEEVSNGNLLDAQSVTTDVRAFENEFPPKLSRTENLNSKIVTDLNSNFKTAKVNISENNNNHFETHCIQNENIQLKHNSMNDFDCGSSVQQNNYQNRSMQSRQYSNEYFDRRSSIHSTSTYVSDYSQSMHEDINSQHHQEISTNATTDHDRFRFKDGTPFFEIKINSNLPKSNINIKYPSNFANLNIGKFENNEVSVNVKENENCDRNVQHHDEMDEGYSTGRPSTSLTNGNFSSTSGLSVTPPSTMYTVIYLTERCNKKVIHIFHLDNDGWVCASEVADAFTNYYHEQVMLKLLKVFNYNVNFKYSTRDTDPQLFSQLDKSELKVPREANKKIRPNFVLTLMTLKTMIQLLTDLDFLDSKMLKAAVPLMKNPKDDTDDVLYKRYNNNILFDVLNLLIQYKKFKQVHKSLIK